MSWHEESQEGKVQELQEVQPPSTGLNIVVHSVHVDKEFKRYLGWSSSPSVHGAMVLTPACIRGVSGTLVITLGSISLVPGGIGALTSSTGTD